MAGVTRPVLRDEQAQRAFDRDGYVRVPMLSKEEVQRLLGSLDALRPADAWAPDGTGPAQNSYHCSFLDSDRAYKRAAFERLSVTFAAVLERQLRDFRALSANFYVKPTGQGRIPIHQNWPVLRSLEDTSVTVWCPLVDASVANGTLHVIPGSHKLVPHIEGPGSLSYFSSFERELDAHWLPLEAEAGEGFIFDDSIVHGSPGNALPQPRIAVQITAIPAQEKPVFYFRQDDRYFEMIDADREFYLEYDVQDLVARRAEWPAGTRVESRNVQLNKEEFFRLLQGKRQRTGASEAVRPAFLQQVARLFRRQTAS